MLTLGVLAWSLQGQQRGCAGPALETALTMEGAVDHSRRPPLEWGQEFRKGPFFPLPMVQCSSASNAR